MEKEILGKSFIENLNKNFKVQSQYFEFNFHVFSELGTIVIEINKCLLLEFHRASITLTNNLLERLLKLALIYNEVGHLPKPTETWNEVFKEPNRKYNTIQLGNSIELCKKFNLITPHEKNYLFEIVRQTMRNGFSHADSSKILENLPDEIKMFQSTFSNPDEIKSITLNQKIIPGLQSTHMRMFAENNSNDYFTFIFELILKIEKRLLDKSK